MESHWSGDSENAFFSADRFDKERVLCLPEYERNNRGSSKDFYYVIGVDVGRKGCTTEVTIIKVTPQLQGHAMKSVVNFDSMEDEHFEQQTIKLKKLFLKFKPRSMVIDGNGMGIGLIDYMVTSQIDPETGDVLPPFGIENDPDGFYKKYITKNTIANAIYIMKANAPINTEAHTYVQSQILTGKVKFLIDENQAKTRLMGQRKGQTMSPEARAEYLKPFQLTTGLRAQLLNLTEENEGVNVKLKMVNRSLGKDRFSSFEYAMWYIRQEEERSKKRRRRKISDFLFFS